MKRKDSLGMAAKEHTQQMMMKNKITDPDGNTTDAPSLQSGTCSVRSSNEPIKQEQIDAAALPAEDDDE